MYVKIKDFSDKVYTFISVLSEKKKTDCQPVRIRNMLE